MMAGAIAFLTMLRMTTVPQKSEEEQVAKTQVVVALKDIPHHTLVQEGDVGTRDVPVDMVPADGMADTKDVLGKLTTADIANGEIVLSRRLIAPDYVGPKAAFVMDPKQVIVALPATDLLTSVGIVRSGDRVDIMMTYKEFSKPGRELSAGMNTLTVLQDVRVAAVVREGEDGQGGAAKALLFALDPQDALILKYCRDHPKPAVFDIALRSPAAEGRFNVVTVDEDFLLNRDY